MYACSSCCCVAPFAALLPDTGNPIWIAIPFSSSSRCSPFALCWKSSRFASLQLGRREETQIELVPDRHACAEKMWCVRPSIYHYMTSVDRYMVSVYRYMVIFYRYMLSIYHYMKSVYRYMVSAYRYMAMFYRCTGNLLSIHGQRLSLHGINMGGCTYVVYLF